MSFDIEDYEFKKEYEKIIIEYIEKIGDLLKHIDEIVEELGFYGLLVKWEDEKESIFTTFNNFYNLGSKYNMWKDHIYHRLSQGDKIIKLKEDLIKKLKQARNQGTII